jgi:two-component system chemotaxis response regulator CheY
MEKVLIVDDSRAIRRILGTTIRALGFEVAEAANGQEALERLEDMDQPVRFMLVDWNMPEMNGLDFILKVRENKRFEESSILMVTTETAVDQMVKALDAGANEYVMKPFTKEIIEDKLRLLGILN